MKRNFLYKEDDLQKTRRWPKKIKNEDDLKKNQKWKQPQNNQKWRRPQKMKKNSLKNKENLKKRVKKQTTLNGCDIIVN